jgi:hypothetical protein
MKNQIDTGTLLLKDDALLPASLQLESEPNSKGWRSVKNLDGYALDRKVREAGWNFFFMADEIEAGAFGFNLEDTTREATKRVLAHLGAEKFNCLQVAQVAVKRFLGLSHVTVSGHRRHIQKGNILFRANGSRNGD